MGMTEIQNPYIVGNPIKSSSMFFGREDEFSFISQKISREGANQLILLCGDRRSGKTSILFQILNGRLGDGIVPVLIDMQMLAGIEDDDSFFEVMYQKICDTLKDKRAIGEKNKSCTGISNFISAIKDLVGSQKNTVLLLFDEYELIEEKINQNILSEKSILFFAGLLESELKISFIFTGSQNLEARDIKIWKVLFGKSIYHKISFLSESDCGDLIRIPLKGLIHYPENMVKEIYRLSGGHPFYTQVLCQNLIDVLIDENRLEFEDGDLKNVVDEISENPMPQMLYAWDSYTIEEQIHLSELSAMIKENDIEYSAADVLKQIKKTGLKFNCDTSKSQITLEKLYHKDFLTKDLRDLYSFRIDLFRIWISKELTIWKVASDSGLRFRKRISTSLLYLAIFFFVVGFLGLLVIKGIIPTTFLPSVKEPIQNPKDEVVQNISIYANDGPFKITVNDGLPYYSVDSPQGEQWITIPLMKAGTYTFVAEHMNNGHIQELKNEIISSSLKVISITFPGAQNIIDEPDIVPYSKITMTSDPPGAMAVIDEYNTRVTPFEILLPPDHYYFKLRVPGYAAAAFEAMTDAGKNYTQHFVLQPAQGVIAVDYQTKGQMLLNGSVVMSLPNIRNITVPPGNYEIEIQDTSGERMDFVTVNLLEGEIFTITENQ